MCQFEISLFYLPILSELRLLLVVCHFCYIVIMWHNNPVEWQNVGSIWLTWVNPIVLDLIWLGSATRAKPSHWLQSIHNACGIQFAHKEAGVEWTADVGTMSRWNDGILYCDHATDRNDGRSISRWAGIRHQYSTLDHWTAKELFHLLLRFREVLDCFLWVCLDRQTQGGWSLLHCQRAMATRKVTLEVVYEVAEFCNVFLIYQLDCVLIDGVEQWSLLPSSLDELLFLKFQNRIWDEIFRTSIQMNYSLASGQEPKKWAQKSPACSVHQQGGWENNTSLLNRAWCTLATSITSWLIKKHEF